jgi:hypothetical protein
MCKLHNDVNRRLGKKEFACGNNLFDLWGGNEDCGCGKPHIESFDGKKEDNNLN